MMTMYEKIKEDFPNAITAIHKMYKNLEESHFYKAEFLVFEKIQYVYEAIANFIPQRDEILFDMKTKEQSKQYKQLNMCSYNRFVKISRIDLIMAILLFTEEFILLPISSRNVILKNNKITIYENFITFKVSKNKEKTYVSILIKDVLLFEYMIQN